MHICTPPPIIWQALVRVFRKAALDNAYEAEKGNSGGDGSVCAWEMRQDCGED